VEYKTEVLSVLEEEVPESLLPTFPAFIATAERLSEQAASPDRKAIYYRECLLGLLLMDRERFLPALPQEARIALRAVARSLITATFPNPSLSAAVVLKFVGRLEDAAFLDAHRPEDPTCAKVFNDTAQLLRSRH
jgi:hypothetical protein